MLLDLGDAANRVTIGRRATNDVALEWDERVSRVHAALDRVGDAWALMDDGLSHNGTWVNGERLSGRRRLADGDTISDRRLAVVVPLPAGQLGVATDGLRASARTSASCSRRRSAGCCVALCRPFKDSHYATPATNQRIAQSWC